MTSEKPDFAERHPVLDRFVPRAGVRVQLVAAALVWLVGSSILVARGATYVSDRYWHSWALAAALAIGVIKSRYLLDGIAHKAIARIRQRGKACFFGFFSVRSWALVGLMMGGGIAIRNAIVHPGVIGAGILGALYLGIGCALFIADRVFWRAVFSEPIPVEVTDSPDAPNAVFPPRSTYGAPSDPSRSER